MKKIVIAILILLMLCGCADTERKENIEEMNVEENPSIISEVLSYFGEEKTNVFDTLMKVDYLDVPIAVGPIDVDYIKNNMFKFETRLIDNDFESRINYSADDKIIYTYEQEINISGYIKKVPAYSIRIVESTNPEYTIVKTYNIYDGKLKNIKTDKYKVVDYFEYGDLDYEETVSYEMSSDKNSVSIVKYDYFELTDEPNSNGFYGKESCIEFYYNEDGSYDGNRVIKNECDLDFNTMDPISFVDENVDYNMIEEKMSKMNKHDNTYTCKYPCEYFSEFYKEGIINGYMISTFDNHYQIDLDENGRIIRFVDLYTGLVYVYTNYYSDYFHILCYEIPTGNTVAEYNIDYEGNLIS